MAFDAAVTHPLKLRAPYRVPLLLMVAGATVDGLAGRVLAKLGHPVPGAQRIVSRTDGSATCWDVDPGP